MICPNCNCELVDGTAVCPYFGTTLAAPAPSATATATMPAIQSAPPAPPGKSLLLWRLCGHRRYFPR